VSADLLPRLTRALGLAVIERISNIGYILAAPAPDWLAGALGTRNTLPSAFPFLGHFLQIAGAAWQEGAQGRAESGPFEATIEGEPMLLRATALTVDGRKLLVVERLTGDADPRPMLQRAREQMLDRERLERQATAVHAPAASIAREIATLASLDLSPEARAVVDRLQQAATTLASAVAALPAPPPKRRARRAQ
jgi:hypothetical protein